MNGNMKNPDYAELLDRFVAHKKLAGYKYHSSEKNLRKFVRFLAESGDDTNGFVKETVEAYTDRTPNESAKTRANRVSDIRQFALYLNKRGYSVYVPRRPSRRGLVTPSFMPYVFSHDEILRILGAADLIKPHARYNCAEVYPILFRTLYGCGLRISEALGLQIKDVDLNGGVLRIRAGKYGKDRLVPMSETLNSHCRALSERIHRHATEHDYFFKNPDGSARSNSVVRERFRKLLWESGIPYMGKGKGPRLHDLRHTFCCHTLKRMSDAGIDLYCALPVLSTYLGHSSIRATEGYLRLTTEFHPDVLVRMRGISSFVFPEVSTHEAY